ncbi:hypothetical protein EJ377_17985 [Chryseobacterium arthrosphaerae]|uniref:Uncharacterized protein n=1 Tax=Chryseobacterium arthrosphaerae TaxID=651561 RepID=A0A3S0N535_9FLAO|nr:hypothetical protein EJ377_17985 [Chryseobacterium arthrosphaerae]
MRPIIIYSNYPLPVDKLLTEEERINITFEEIDELKISINDQHGTFEQTTGLLMKNNSFIGSSVVFPYEGEFYV